MHSENKSSLESKEFDENNQLKRARKLLKEADNCFDKANLGFRYNTSQFLYWTRAANQKFAEAKNIYEEAHKKGSFTATIALGDLYRQQDQKKASELYQNAFKACQIAHASGDPKASTMLGILYKEHKGVKQSGWFSNKSNNIKALKLFREAAQKDDPRGLLELGLLQMEGPRGIKTDYKAAAHCLREAAEKAIKEGDDVTVARALKGLFSMYKGYNEPDMSYYHLGMLLTDRKIQAVWENDKELNREETAPVNDLDQWSWNQLQSGDYLKEKLVMQGPEKILSHLMAYHQQDPEKIKIEISKLKSMYPKDQEFAKFVDELSKQSTEKMKQFVEERKMEILKATPMANAVVDLVSQFEYLADTNPDTKNESSPLSWEITPISEEDRVGVALDADSNKIQVSASVLPSSGIFKATNKNEDKADIEKDLRARLASIFTKLSDQKSFDTYKKEVMEITHSFSALNKLTSGEYKERLSTISKQIDVLDDLVSNPVSINRLKGPR